MAMTEERRQALKKMLSERRREVWTSKPQASLRKRAMRKVEDVDPLEESRKETLDRLCRAERRLAEGSYGVCFGCQDEISLERLTALPFVVICKRCDDEAELQALQERVPQNRWGRLFAL